MDTTAHAGSTWLRHMAHNGAKRLTRGEIVEVEWDDTHAAERLTHEDIEELEDPAPTVAYGVVLTDGPRYLTIASEVCLDPHSDGSSVEQIPHGAIRKVRRLGRKSLDIDTSGNEDRL